MSSRSDDVMKRALHLGLCAAALLAGCGGNYSNEDIDFQLALPERDDIAVKLPAQSLEVEGAAEHYRITRGTVRDLNGVADAFLSLIDGVRAYAPTERSGGRRVWGPFPVAGHPMWFVRMVMDRVGDPNQPARFDYQVEFRSRLDATAPWTPIITGEFAPRAGVRRGVGVFHFVATGARAAGYPLEGLVGVERLDIQYSTAEFPLRAKIDSVDYPGGRKASYEYQQEQDGAGSMLFTFPTPNLGIWVSALEIRSRWKGTGAGRADVRVVGGLALDKTGVECWGTDTRRTYQKTWDDKIEGVESDCVFGPP
jgi:hypothetical protein